MKRELIQNEYMFDTKVENVFINEYMISAPGNFVKVYLVALMYVDLGNDVDDELIAKNLGIEKEEVERAWQYWLNLGVVKMFKGEIVFVNLKESIYGKKKKEKPRTNQPTQNSLHILDNSLLKDMFATIEKVLARPLNGSETQTILDWIDIIGATPEVVAYAYTYCVARKKDNIKYIASVVEGWTKRGFTTTKQVEDFIAESDQRFYVYKRIMKSLGFTRNATEEERRIIDKWLDEYNFSMDSILNACNKTSGISNPNINYVNKVLLNLNRQKTGKDEKGQVTRKHVMDYYEHIREKAKEDARTRKEEIIACIPQIGQLEEEINANYLSLTKLAIGGGANKLTELTKIKKKNEELKKEINRLLTSSGVPIDYMEVHYKCPLCKDTGTLEDGRQCSCYIKRSEEAGKWNKK